MLPDLEGSWTSLLSDEVPVCWVVPDEVAALREPDVTTSPEVDAAVPDEPEPPETVVVLLDADPWGVTPLPPADHRDEYVLGRSLLPYAIP